MGKTIVGIIFMSLVAIVILSLLFMLVGLLVQESLGLNKEIFRKGDCFDEFKNKINNLTCDIKEYCSKYWVSFYPKCEEINK